MINRSSVYHNYNYTKIQHVEVKGFTKNTSHRPSMKQTRGELIRSSVSLDNTCLGKRAEFEGQMFVIRMHIELLVNKPCGIVGIDACYFSKHANLCLEHYFVCF